MFGPYFCSARGVFRALGIYCFFYSWSSSLWREHLLSGWSGYLSHPSAPGAAMFSGSLSQEEAVAKLPSIKDQFTDVYRSYLPSCAHF